ncbi:MAG: LysR family transcriptional regulator [Deltaproteobacteria bacterium]|nr:LysR family transcriptional regulator [Deltaproteobacteria bacterium]
MATLEMRSKHWIVDEKGNIIMGEGRREIFENIQITGSLNQTAKIMKMSYRGVWGRIKATEKVLKKKVVHTDRRLGSSLTKEGEKLLEKYRLLKKKCVKEDDKIFDSMFKKNADEK